MAGSHQSLADIRKQMAAKALRGRQPASGTGVMRTTDDDDFGRPKINFTPALPPPENPAPAGASRPGAEGKPLMGKKPDSESDEEPSGAERLQEELEKKGVKSVVSPITPAALSTSTGKVPSHRLVDITDRRSFLGHCPPKEAGIIMCHVVREKSGMKKFHPEYSMYLERPGGEHVFLLAARKRKMNKTSNYLVSMDAEDLHRNSGNYYGKVRSNFVGTEFTIYDKGEKHSREGCLAHRQELGAILYETNILGSKGPRRMSVVIPSVDADGKRAQWKQETEDSESLIAAYRAGERKSDMMILENKRPTWNEELRAYVLNFGGRVTVASVKNFQLAEKDSDKVLVQFGKVDSNKFSLDFQYPVNGLQAFCVALTAFDNKLACD